VYKKPSRPIYQQLAVGLYVLGSTGGGGVQRSRIALNIGQGTIVSYVWRVIQVICKLLPMYIRWPSFEERSREAPNWLFKDCIGFLDGSIMILRDKPTVDHEAYFSRKKVYGLNVQAVCDWNRRFMFVSMGHTAAVHDSTAFKESKLYKNRFQYFRPQEYLLADKAYALQPHVITPYKDPEARKQDNARFNYQLSIPRVKIEHAFGVLKARFPSLRSMPIRIGTDQLQGHERVTSWISTCMVLHNILHSMKDDESWLEELTIQEKEPIIVTQMRDQELEVPTNNMEARAGKVRRDELRNRCSMNRTN